MAVRCSYCGFENVDRTSFCNSCGKEIGSPTTALRLSDPRHCVSCGRSIQSDANVCPYCGHDYRAQWMRPQAVDQISSGMKILFYILSLVFPLAGFIIGIVYYSKGDPESKHVGKICIILAVVGILATVGLAAVLYVMVLGFGPDDVMQTPVAALSKNTITNGVKITIVSITKTDVPWDDVEIQVSDGTNIAQWSPTKAFQSTTVGHNYSTSTALTGLTVCLWIYDVSGNGFVSGTDYFTLTTSGGPMFSSSTTYTVTIVYAPTGSSMTSASFTG